MTLNGRQKVGVAVLAVGLGALAVDRVFVLPQNAPASEKKGFVDVYTATSSPGAVAATPATSARVTVAERLEAVWSDKRLTFEAPRDLFSLPNSWRRASGPATPDRSTVGAAGRFSAAHSLEAIIIDAYGDRALIDDKLVRLGERLDGYALVSVEKEFVVFEGNGERITLRLAEGR